ncbi:MAG: hypothetical protein AUK47_16170 [Deltaproteobacteria bacterium CG2_30_63_29]|nr:MAG: hypothetical protein AUK47_16170 [Deltaproteobacteria bacterium CG2_30_63_29]PIW00248.1 MAG: hypothetical protein COW42_08410 [Deltaproteobacteria bacterium CG17_big_fil_post_rev_8_21_14_2_50_63_7]PJB33482.1 MAG: hypothetical protein CO108_30930 [Deltaproteobacteria bacterium CG_4_9_14_3_um_filter_63_12]
MQALRPASSSPFLLFVFGGSDAHFGYRKPDGSMVDPASCGAALTVGAVSQSQFHSIPAISIAETQRCRRDF